MRYQVFARTGLVVAEAALGAGCFGTRWGYGAAPDEARSMYRGYVEAGGNFIDTADAYQFGESETLLSELIAADRNELVLASKYTGGTDPAAGAAGIGNSRKAMVQSVEASLERLKTDRIDLYWVHYPDERTPVDEIARGFEDLVRSGKIIYAGLSDFPAWRIARAATLAELRGWVPISGLQMEYSLVERTPDRELLPMASAFGLCTTAWGVLGGGLLTGKYRRGEEGRADTFKQFYHDERTPQKAAIMDAVMQVAQELGVTPGQVAVAWVRARGIIPILGPRTRAQLDDTLGGLTVKLTAEHMQRLDAVSAVPPGFPHEMIAATTARDRANSPQLKHLFGSAASIA